MHLLLSKLQARFARDDLPHDPRDLLAWGRAFLPEHFSRPASRMHTWLAAELGDATRERGRKINLLGPRGHAKSTLASLAYVLRQAVEAREPYIWIVSDTAHQAIGHLDNIRHELEHNPHLREHFPLAVGKGPRWRESGLTLKNGTIIEAYGTGQRIRGKRAGAHRPSLIVCDDLQNDGHIASAAQRESSRAWFHSALLPAGTPQSNVVNLATSLHRDALAMQLHRAPGWRSKIFRAIEAWPAQLELWKEWEQLYCDVEAHDAAAAAQQFYREHQAELHAGACVLWPEVEDLLTLMKLRIESGRTAFEREKQCEPIDPERCEFTEEDFAEHIWFDRWPKELTLRVLALDPSKGGDARHGDYSAFVLLGVGKAGELFVEADLARRPIKQIVSDAVDLAERFRPQQFGVEANQFQELLQGEISRALAAAGLAAIPLGGIHNYLPKAARIRRLGAFLSQRRLRFLKNSPGTQLLVDQLRDFPLASHDDGPDALEMALRLALEKSTCQTQTDGLGDQLIPG